jgi:hypothetical protein
MARGERGRLLWDPEMNLVSEYHEDKTSAVRRVRNGHDSKSTPEEWMPRINHFDFVGCLERFLGLAQTCSIKLRALWIACQSSPTP